MARSNNFWFTFAGSDSRNMGVHVLGIPSLPIAEELGAEISVLGRDGPLWQSEGAYQNIELDVALELLDGTDPTTVAAWLSGSGELVLSEWSTRCYRARVIAGFNLDRDKFACGIYAGSVTFTCQPYQYQIGNPAMADITSPGTFTGNGNSEAHPIITIYGDGDITLMVNDASMVIDDVSSSITIDCDALMAIDANGQASSRVTITSNDDEWATLVPGTNTINWSGNVSKVSIKPQWRWR